MGWSGCLNAAGNVCTIASLTATTSVKAQFHTVLQVTTAGSGSGRVTSTPPLIDCGAGGTACSATYPAATAVTFTAAASATSTFTGWGGDCASAGTAATCNLTMDQGHVASATFALSRSLAVAKYLDGTSSGVPGTVAFSSGANSGSCAAPACSTLAAPLADGSTATITAAPAPGYLFQSWSGDCSGNSLTCNVTMSADQSVQANFVPNVYNLFFVTSASYLPTLGSSAAYDTKCNLLASAAGINNPTNDGFIAYVSDSTTPTPRNVADLLSGVSGSFTRVDGQPVALKAADLFPATGKPVIIYPPNLDENGVTYPGGQPGGTKVLTGTSNSGTATSNCNNWTSPSAIGSYGGAWSGPLFSNWAGQTCSGSWHFYCVEKDRSAPTFPPLSKPAGSKYAYVAPFDAFFSSDASSAAAACNFSKPTGMIGSALALLATTTQSAATRALKPATLYVRPDNAAVGLGSEIAAGTLRTGMWLNAQSQTVNANVWTGATSPSLVGTLGTTCNDWNSTGSAQYGASVLADKNFYYLLGQSQGCPGSSTFGFGVYCIEQ